MKKLFAILLVPFFAACSQIDTGNVGVESTLGQVKPETMAPGVYFTAFKRVTEVIAKEIPLQLDDMKPQTSDKITLADLDIDIYIQIDPSKAADIMTRWPGDVTHEKGEDGNRIGMNYVTRQARENIYNTITKYGSATVHTERTSIAAAVVKQLQEDLDESAGTFTLLIDSDAWGLVTSDDQLAINSVNGAGFSGRIKISFPTSGETPAEDNIIFLLFLVRSDGIVKV